MKVELKDGKVVLRNLNRPLGDFPDEALPPRVRVRVERSSTEFTFGIFHPRDSVLDSVGSGASVFINGLLAFHHPLKSGWVTGPPKGGTMRGRQISPPSRKE